MWQPCKSHSRLTWCSAGVPERYPDMHVGSLFQPSCSPTYSSDGFILEQCSAGHTVSQASMEPSWQRVWPTFSHAGRCFNPGSSSRAGGGGVVLLRRVAMEQHGDSASWRSMVRSQVTCFFFFYKGHLFVVSVCLVHLQSKNIQVK